MAKMQATESAQQVIDAAVQMFGGRGVRSGEVVERLYREIRSLRIYDGATEVQKLIIARELLKSKGSESIDPGERATPRRPDAVRSIDSDPIDLRGGAS